MSNTAAKTEIKILGTLHGLHKINPAYTFDDVFRIINDFNPDAAAVEIRSEDIDQSRDYLSKYYPFEMIETKIRFSDKFPVYGFDWLGDSIKGKTIPDGYFQNHPVKKLEAELENSQYPDKAELEKFDAERMKIVQNATAEQCNDGRYDKTSEEYYSRLAAAVKGTKFQPMTDFYRQRDENIARSIISIIEQNQGKRIIFLMGMDHRAFAIKNIRARFGDKIIIK